MDHFLTKSDPWSDKAETKSDWSDQKIVEESEPTESKSVDSEPKADHSDPKSDDPEPKTDQIDPKEDDKSELVQPGCQKLNSSFQQLLDQEAEENIQIAAENLLAEGGTLEDLEKSLEGSGKTIVSQRG